MGLNALGEKKLRQLKRITGGYYEGEIIRATVYSHADYWRVRITLKPHRHVTYNRRTRASIIEPKGRSYQCTSLCRRLFPEDFDEPSN